MEVNRYRIDQLLHTIKTFGTSFTPDEKSIVYISNETGTQNAFSISVNGVVPRQLTHSTQHVRYASISPDNYRLFFCQDQGSIENTHLLVLETDGTQRLLTPSERVQVRFMGWNPDNSSFYCATNERDERYYDLYKIDATTYARELIYKDQAGLHFCTISNNERYAAFMRINSRADSDVFLF